jgi:hypothetical protein
MSTTVRLCKEDVVLISDRNSKGDLVVSEVQSPAVAHIIDTEQNVNAAAGAEVPVPNLDGGGADVMHDHDNNNDSEQRSFS